MVADHFTSIGVKKIVAFVPQWRNKGGQVKDPKVRSTILSFIASQKWMNI